jgi:hypothetical protein
MAPSLYLGFDAATKTFAWSLARLDLGLVPGILAEFAAARRDLTKLHARAAAGETSPDVLAEIQRLTGVLASLQAAIDATICVLAGAVIDLAPGVADNALPTIARLRAVTHYVRDVVCAAVDQARADAARADRVQTDAARADAARADAARTDRVQASEDANRLHVVVEYQLGDNAPARAVANALVTLFADDDVVLVGASLKNTIALGPGLALGDFIPKYTKLYTANKNHARANFDRVLELFPNALKPVNAAGRGHIADSFMQILGMLVNGDGNESSRY